MDSSIRLHQQAGQAMHGAMRVHLHALETLPLLDHHVFLTNSHNHLRALCLLAHPSGLSAREPVPYLFMSLTLPALNRLLLIGCTPLALPHP